jgi:hypothetical protein
LRKDVRETGSLVGEASLYISGIGKSELPAEVRTKAKQHVLDTLAAIVSGSTLKAGRLAREYAKRQRGVEEAKVSGNMGITEEIARLIVDSCYEDFTAEVLNIAKP